MCVPSFNQAQDETPRNQENVAGRAASRPDSRSVATFRRNHQQSTNPSSENPR
ncbi:MAG: hypothetical protein BJ554DRAFT_6778 [Olpidium bornovanus]|uniref:Uncharacterized protein n=1 Tax=Olpidium bornovanus TaxID=278681 RepID=A0A8H8A1Y7_9FUNG|nr:MAG: hypothetical protein BJ554DRAFT_6778 [Olpidium bornovanus]